ncbi:MAG: MFS transporter [Coriobacteriia bacterium]|nr:MFS transporter [Coriobacteriia bacterium]
MAADDARFTRTQVLTLVATVACSGVVFLDSSLANVALPAIQRELHMTTAQQQWVASAYLLTVSTLLLVGGRLADVYGRRRLFMSGLAAYAVFSVAVALSPAASFLIGARAMQGVAGAMLVPTSLALVNATFPRRSRGRAIGVWSAWSGIITVLGPVLGGLLIDNVTWRVALLITPALALFAIWAGRALVESRDQTASRKPDVVGALLVAAMAGGPVFALIQGPVSGWGSAEVVAGVVTGSLAAPAFLLWERRTSSPMVPLEVFANRDLVAANVATLFVYAALYGSFFYVTIYIQSALGVSATIAGAVFIPVTVLLFFLSPYAGRLNDRHGPRWLMAFGGLGAAAGFALMAFTGPGQVFTVLVPGVLLLGAGLGFTVAPLTATAIGSTEERYSGVASGLNNAVSRVAALVSIAALGVVVVAIWREGLATQATALGLGASARAALADVRDTAFVLPGDAAAREAALAAAQRAYRDGMLLVAALAAIGGAVSAIWIREGSTAAAGEEPAGEPAEEPAEEPRESR